MLNEDKSQGAMVFAFQYSPKDPAITMTLPPDISLDDVFDAFEGFLLAVGYVFNGRICIDHTPVENLPEIDGNVDLN